jgi:hypothetical protein
MKVAHIEERSASVNQLQRALEQYSFASPKTSPKVKRSGEHTCPGLMLVAGGVLAAD